MRSDSERRDKQKADSSFHGQKLSEQWKSEEQHWAAISG